MDRETLPAPAPASALPAAEKDAVVPVARRLTAQGFRLIATRGTGEHLHGAGLEVEFVSKVREGSPHIVDALLAGEVAIVVNTPAPSRSATRSRSGGTVLECRVPYFPTLAAAAAAAEGIELVRRGPFTVRPLQEHHRTGHGQGIVRTKTAALVRPT